MPRLALPTMAAQLVDLLYNLTDRVFIGHIPDGAGLALTGVGVCLPIVLVVSSFGMFAGSGGAPLASVALGEGKGAEANRVVGNVLALIILFAICMMVTLGLTMDFLLPFFGASTATFPYAQSYLAIYLAGTPFVMGSLAFNAILLAQGDSRLALWSVGLGAVLNIILDALLIFFLLLGVQGAALATVMSEAANAITAFAFLRRKSSVLRPQLRYLRLDGAHVKSILALGSAPFFITTSEALMIVVFNGTLLAYGGDVYVGAMVVLQAFSQMFFSVSNGFTRGVQPIISYGYGAGCYERVRRAAKATIVTTTALVAVIVCLVIAFSGFFASLFSSDEAIRGLVVQMTPVYCCVFVLFGIQTGMQTVFMGLKQGLCSLSVAAARKIVFMIPLAFALPHFVGAWGVFLAEPISDACSITFCSILFAWRIPKILEGPEDEKRGSAYSSPHGGRA